MEVFDSDKLLSSLIPEVVGRMNSCSVLASSILKVFLGSYDVRQRRLFEAVDKQGVINLSFLAEQISNDPKAMSGVVIRTVFGATENMPFRALHYLLPAIQMVEALAKAYRDKNRSRNDFCYPQIEFLFMNQAGVLINGLDQTKTEIVTNQFISVARSYIKEFHPQVSPHVRFVGDECFSPKVIKSQSYLKVVEKFSYVLKDYPDLLSKFMEMAREDLEKAIKYASLHFFVHDVYPNPSFMGAFLNLLEEEIDSSNYVSPEYLVSMGAKPAKTFHQARRIISHEFSNKIREFSNPITVQYIVGIGAPPYQPFHEYDLLLSEAIFNPLLIDPGGDFHSPVKKAIETLVADINPNINFGLSELRRFIWECGAFRL